MFYLALVTNMVPSTGPAESQRLVFPMAVAVSSVNTTKRSFDAVRHGRTPMRDNWQLKRKNNIREIKISVRERVNGTVGSYEYGG